jgi:hypothetical protein
LWFQTMSSATDIHGAWTLAASSIAGDAQMVLGKAANAMVRDPTAFPHHSVHPRRVSLPRPLYRLDM